MATAYTEFHCLGADLLTNLQTAILASSDWSRPNAAGKPTLYKATTTRGAEMALDISAVAPTNTALTVDFFRTHDGTTGVDSARRWLRHKTGAGTFASIMYHGVVSVGKEHLYISIEGPRPGETSPDNSSYGSIRNYVFLADLVPYYPTADTVPAVVHGGSPVNGTPSALASLHHYAWASRDALNVRSWSPGKLLTLTFPGSNSNNRVAVRRETALDGGKYHLAPYVFFDNVDGIRGRLAAFFCAGYSSADLQDVPPSPVGEVITFEGQQYKLLQVNKSESSSEQWGAFGAALNSSAALHNASVVVAVPYA